MKNALRLLGVIVLATVIGFTFAACDNGSGNTHQHQWGAWQSNATAHWKECSCGEEYNRANHDGSPCSVCGYTGGGTPNLSLDGVWKSTSGNVMSIYDNKAVATEIVSANWKEAEKRGNVGIGSLVFRNITSTGNSTWSGQGAVVNPTTYVVSWGGNTTFTLSADGQTLTTDQPGTTTPTSTWTRVRPNGIDGVWKGTSGGNVMSIYDNKAVATEIVAANWKEAEKRGNVGIGSLVYRNITSAGALTWTGQGAVVSPTTYEVSWGGDVTFTLSADGETLTTYQPGTTTPTGTWTRQQ